MKIGTKLCNAMKIVRKELIGKNIGTRALVITVYLENKDNVILRYDRPSVYLNMEQIASYQRTNIINLEKITVEALSSSLIKHINSLSNGWYKHFKSDLYDGPLETLLSININVNEKYMQ